MSAEKSEVLAEELVNRMTVEKNASALYVLASGLARFRANTLTSQQLDRISRVFEVPNNHCALVLRLGDASKQAQLLRQLHNPLCAENDRKQLALGLAQLTSQPLAAGELSKPSEIKIDFPKLYDYVASQRSWRDRWKLSWPQELSLILILGSLVTLIVGLMKSPSASTPIEPWI